MTFFKRNGLDMKPIGQKKVTFIIFVGGTAFLVIRVLPASYRWDSG